MADLPDEANPTTGSVSYVDPDELHKNPAFTNVVVVEGPVRTVHVGGQNAVDSSGDIVGKGDVAAQTRQVVENLRAALAAGTAEQWIKEGKYTLNWTRLSCHIFVANQARLQLFVLAYNLGNFLRRLALPKVVKEWSLRSLQLKLIKTCAKLVHHARRLVFQLAEVAVSK